MHLGQQLVVSAPGGSNSINSSTRAQRSQSVKDDGDNYGFEFMNYEPQQTPRRRLQYSSSKIGQKYSSAPLAVIGEDRVPSIMYVITHGNLSKESSAFSRKFNIERH